MKPSKPENGAVVDLVDAILRDGVVLQADVIISVADIPLVGLKLRAALAGMDTMTEYGIFEEWDAAHRRRALDAEDADTDDEQTNTKTDE
ncbi:MULTISPECIES: gas vesicle protein GvpM [Halococcus]|uniref:Gas vesicle protein n=1 Tax=Halococcus salifodinae DSM 8989 TaxID=1227456 RepID=M0MZ86_9EURY|nr:MULTISPECIES: gas vesicle protein [Halococcus]EMA51017.1 Gas vesicle protein [Halococcus salifodinae DSM 8989]